MFKIMDNGCFNNYFIKNKNFSECYPCYKAQDHKRILECGLYSVTGYKSARIYIYFVLQRNAPFSFFKLRAMKRKRPLWPEGQWVDDPCIESN